MPRGRKFKAEAIIGKLREAEVELARGKKIPDVYKQICVTPQTYYRWKKEYGGLRMDQARRLTSEDILERLSDLFVRRGVPTYIRSDNGSEFTAMKVRE